MDVVSHKLDEVIHELAVMDIDASRSQFESDKLLAKLKSMGTEVWVDTGELEKAREVWKQELTALTTNNTLANQVVQSGIMDDLIRETAGKVREVASEMSEADLVTEIGFVINCRIALRLVQAFKEKVSVELHPAMSRDIEKTLYYGRRYFKVCPQYFNIKVPLTPEGFLAVRTLSREGMPVNFTLGFSVRQNYLAARLSNPAYVNVFLGRLNQVVIDNSMGSGDLVGEKVTLATQAAVRQAREQFTGVTTKLIGASIRNGAQVGFLAGMDVQTIPPKAIQEFLGSGISPEQITCNMDRDIQPGVDGDASARSRVAELWELQDTFKRFVDELLNEKKLDEFSGEDLVKFCKHQGINLFHDFSQDDLKRIQDCGKIPRLSDWSQDIALDDLMTQSALQSFTKDQNELDERIRSFL